MQERYKIRENGNSKHECLRKVGRLAVPMNLITPTIFHEPWWLELACNGDCREVKIEIGGRLVGRLPYMESKVFGQTTLKMPLLTYVLGPAISTQAGSASSISREAAITAKLIDQLPKAAHISFRLHGNTSNTLAFEAAGFVTGTQFTIEVSPASYDQLWKQMRGKTRNSVRRAQDHLSVVELNRVSDFLDFYEENLIMQSRVNFYEKSLVNQIVTQSLARGVGRILATVDAKGQYHSAIFTVWDESSEYYLMSTRKMHCTNGAVSVLIWNAVQHAALNNVLFDMGGIHIVRGRMPNLLFLSGFGGNILPRFTVRRTSTTIEIFRRFHRFVRWS